MILVVVTPALGPQFLETPSGMTLKMLFFAGVVHNASEMRRRHKITITSDCRQTDLECTKPVISKGRTRTWSQGQFSVEHPAFSRALGCGRVSRSLGTSSLVKWTSPLHAMKDSSQAYAKLRIQRPQCHPYSGPKP